MQDEAVSLKLLLTSLFISLHCICIYSELSWCNLVFAQQVKEWQDAWEEGDKKEMENQAINANGMSCHNI